MLGSARSSQRGMYQDFSFMSVRSEGTRVIRTISASVGSQPPEGDLVISLTAGITTILSAFVGFGVLTLVVQDSL